MAYSLWPAGVVPFGLLASGQWLLPPQGVIADCHSVKTERNLLKQRGTAIGH